MATAPVLVALPHATRKQVFDALFQYMSYLPAPTGNVWITQSQYLQHWDDVPPNAQPAIYLVRGPQEAVQNKAFGVTRWQYRCTIWTYFRTDSYKTENTYPDMVTDAYLDAFEQLFQTDPLVGRLTLGGVVYHTWIDGSIFCEPGLVDNQALVIVPISILL